MKSEGFICRNLTQTLKTRLLLLKYGLTAATVEADIGIHKNILGSEIRPSDLAQWTRIVWDKETNDIMKTVKCLEKSC